MPDTGEEKWIDSLSLVSGGGLQWSVKSEVMFSTGKRCLLPPCHGTSPAPSGEGKVPLGSSSDSSYVDCETSSCGL